MNLWEKLEKVLGGERYSGNKLKKYLEAQPVFSRFAMDWSDASTQYARATFYQLESVARSWIHLCGPPAYDKKLTELEDDPINRPAHYTGHPSGVECIQITEHMSFNLGNAVKYIWRADLKENRLVDLKKAEFYIKREISRLKTIIAPR